MGTTLDNSEGTARSGAWPGAAERGLFTCAFIALFAELMLIRWVPAALELVGYYSNLLLVSSFFGLGLGVLLAGRRSLFGWFPALLLLEVLVIVAAQHVALPTAASTDELRFQGVTEEGARLRSYVVLIAVFAVNSAVLVPIGQRLGELFSRAPVLRAYTFDLGGSLAGTVAFGLFSYTAFSPVVGVAIPLGLHALMATWRQRLVGLPLGLAALGLMGQATDPNAVWSPYYYIVIKAPGGTRALSVPPPDVRTRTNPPGFVVSVNHNFYQYHGTIDPARFDERAPGLLPPDEVRERYAIPYALRPDARSALVLGAGGGLDVEAALLHGVTQVDAVDIDPGLIALARSWSANGVYDDPRVRVRVDDARAFLEREARTYDCVVYGLLDSQALFSSMSNVRLDGYVYTVEGIRAGWQRVAPGGVLSLSFYVAGQQWLAVRLEQLVKLATGLDPILYTEGKNLVIVVGRGAIAPPARIGTFARLDRLEGASGGAATIPTDDWPFLYLRERTIPRDYLLVLVTLAAGVVVTIAAARPVGGRLGAPEAQAFFLGAGFLLLQTKSITDCSVYFGATWLVTTVVVTGVLLMVLLANLATIKGVGRASYVSLFAALVVTCAMPREWILGLPLGGRLAWAALAVPLPIFFAGQIFSTAFRAAPRPAALFGANLLGATLGGLCEYGAMVVGSRGLSVLLIGLYALSLVAARRAAPAAMRE
ncbi:MAG: hypothetical protein KIT58_16565 [Planctomycetota bacterium]|nr:hypothetical protein [Planctomycetota bacterium]